LELKMKQEEEERIKKENELQNSLEEERKKVQGSPLYSCLFSPSPTPANSIFSEIV